jgi:hypothetical protein
MLTALGYYFYRQGKKTVTLQALPNDLPGNPGSVSAGASNNEIKLIAQQLYDDMDGYNFAGHNYDPYNRAITLSDTDLVKLYNTFNSLYQADSKETLKQWIESESYYSNDLPDALLARFAKLNLM